MPFQITESSPSPGLAVYQLHGRLTAGADVTLLESAIARTIACGVRNVVMDMTALNYLDSAGLGSLIHCLSQLKQRGGTARFAAVDERVLKIIKLARMHSVLPVDLTVEEACRKVEG